MTITRANCLPDAGACIWNSTVSLAHRAEAFRLAANYVVDLQAVGAY